LVKLPADEKVLEAIDNISLAYDTTFPLGQPFKSLYAIHALHEYLGSWRPGTAVPGGDDQRPVTDGNLSPRAAFLIRAMSLVVMAISDPQVVAQCPNQEMQIELGSALVGLFVSLLGGTLPTFPPQTAPCLALVLTVACSDPDLPTSAAESLTAPLLDRLLSILLVGVSATCPKRATKHAGLCFQSILESCCLSNTFMSAFAAHPEVPDIIGKLLLQDPRVTVRQTTALLIRQKTGTVAEGERYEQALLSFSARILTCLPQTVQ
jgi:ubiquitin carboxyl-terminal hydrolase 34